MKKQYGLERNTANKEMFAVLLNSVSVLRDEIAKHFYIGILTKTKKVKTTRPSKR